MSRVRERNVAGLMGARKWLAAGVVVTLVAACGGGTTSGTEGEAATTTSVVEAEAETTVSDVATESTNAMDAGSDTTSSSSEEADAGGFEVIDGVLQPLADGFPSDTITLWDPFEPGSHNDLFNKHLADVGAQYSPVPIATMVQPMGPNLHWDLVRYLADQPTADEGYHLYGISWSGLFIRRYTSEGLGDRAIEELQPVADLIFSPYILVVSHDSEFKTIEDVEEWARENPGELKLASSSPGGGLHTSALVWGDQAGIEFTYIPTSGAAEALQVLEGGGAQIASVSLTLGVEERFNVVMVTGNERVEHLPDVPAAAELGYSIPSGGQFGVGALAAVPQAHIDWLYELFRMVATDSEFQSRYEGWTVTTGRPEEVVEARDAVLDAFLPVLDEAGLLAAD